MWKSLALASSLALVGAQAQAANYTIPSWSSTGATPATGATCVPSASSLAIPIPAGTVIFICTVAPTAWVPGVASSNEANLGVGTYTNGAGAAASTFTLVTIAAVTTPQTFAANTGSITP